MSESLREKMKHDQEEMGRGGSDFFKFENKETAKIRILTEPEVIGTHFFKNGPKPSVCYGMKKGCPFHEPNEDGEEPKLSIKYTCYIIDRADGKVKIADLPYTIIKEAASLQEDEDWSFDGYPMPYDLKIAFDKDLSPAEMYKVKTAATREPVSDEIMGILTEKMSKNTPAQMIEKKKQYQMGEHKKSGMWLSPEVLAQKEKDRVEKFHADVAEHKKKPKEKEDTIEYPQEDINPDDIPF